jgi:hypothetical protein
MNASGPGWQKARSRIVHRAQGPWEAFASNAVPDLPLLASANNAS